MRLVEEFASHGEFEDDFAGHFACAIAKRHHARVLAFVRKTVHCILRVAPASLQ